MSNNLQHTLDDLLARSHQNTAAIFQVSTMSFNKQDELSRVRASMRALDVMQRLRIPETTSDTLPVGHTCNVESAKAGRLGNLLSRKHIPPIFALSAVTKAGVAMAVT
jgi:hypothetical protein